MSSMEIPAPPPPSDLNALRLEGMVIIDRCLRERHAAAFERFLAAQLDAEPPPLQLLQELAQDVQQRLQAMRQSHFDQRDGLLRQLAEAAAAHTPPHSPTPAGFSRLSLDQIQHALAESSLSGTAELSTLLEDAQRAEGESIAQQRMLQQVHAAIHDWLRGFSVITARQAQHNTSTQFVQSIWSIRL